MRKRFLRYKETITLAVGVITNRIINIYVVGDNLSTTGRHQQREKLFNNTF